MNGRVCLQIAVAGLLAFAMVSPVSAGRYETLTEWAKKGSKLKPVAATYFGGPGIEEFVGVAGLEDGRVIAFGNAWGPDFPEGSGIPKATVLGKGKRAGVDPMNKDKKGRQTPDGRSPDRSGFIVFYAPNLAKIESVVRMDWGVGSITAAAVGQDGSIYIAGNCSPMFDKLAKPKVRKPDPKVFVPPTDRKQLRRWNKNGPSWGPFEHKGLKLSGNVYVAKLSPDGKQVEWSWVLAGFRNAPDQLWVSDRGEVTFASRAVFAVRNNGKVLDLLLDKTPSKTRTLRAVNPKDGSFLWGGDNNTNTGREPWRRPSMTWYDRDGKEKQRLWGWDAKRVGTDQYRLVSDSSPRTSTFTEEGDLLVTGWSDGGNSVFTRQPLDLDASSGKSAGQFSAWGMKRANSLAWIMQIDPKSFKVIRWTQFLAYVPDTFSIPRDRGAPNFVQIDRVGLIDRGHIAFAGRAATGLIQTPNAFYKYPNDGSKSGGPFAAVFSKDMKSLLYSSHLPGYQRTAIARAPKGMVIAGSTKGDDGRVIEKTGKPTPTPVFKAIQKQFGGQYDGHIILLQG